MIKAIFLRAATVATMGVAGIGVLKAAQVDITMVPNNLGQLEVKLKPQSNFDGLISSLVFTIKWDASSEAHLGEVIQDQAAGVYLPVSRSGGEQESGGDRYQIFVGFGMTPLEWLSTQWTAGQEYTIATLSVTGTAEFSLVNNSWTGLNNADYYLALGGIDHTGDIYGDLTTGVVAGEFAGAGVAVVPNPTDKATMVTMELGNHAQDLRLELVNAAGQVIWKEERTKAVGSLRIPLDLGNYDKGVYMLRVHSADRTITPRVVKR